MPGDAYSILCTCVPEPEILKVFIARWAKIYVADLCAEVERIQAMRTRIHKIDGNYKMAKVALWDGFSSQRQLKTVALVVTNEEGFLAFVPGLATNEGRLGFREHYYEKLVKHRAANMADEPLHGLLLGLGCDDMGYQMVLTQIVAEVWQEELRSLGLHGTVSELAQALFECRGKQVGAEFYYFLDVSHANFSAAKIVSTLHPDYRDFMSAHKGQSTRLWL